MKLYIICFSLLLTGCSTIAVRHPVDNISVNSLTLNWCISSTSKMNIINKTLSDQQNKIEFDKRNFRRKLLSTRLLKKLEEKEKAKQILRGPARKLQKKEAFPKTSLKNKFQLF